MKRPFADNRAEFVVNLARIRRMDSVLTIGVAHIPEIERIIERVAKNCACIDFDANKISHAKKYTKKTEFILGDITKLNKKLENKFDTVIMLEVLEHIDDDLSVLRNIYKMLKKKGKLIITVPNKHFLHIINPVKYTQHKRHYSMRDIINVLKKTGFSIEYTNTVESKKLMFDLYVHLFCKFILRKSIPFGVLTGKKDRTYMNNNRESEGLDCIVVGVKI